MHTDPILYWNAVALEANRVSHTNGKNEQTGPCASARALAIVHLAMYDAFVGTDTGTAQDPYLPGLPAAAPGASIDAAVAAAAHLTLSKLFPTQKSTFNGKLAEAALPAAGKAEGTAFGLLVGQALLAERSSDPGTGDFGYEPPVNREAHRPDPDDAGQGFHAPFFGAQSSCFAVTVAHELDAYPDLSSKAYLDAVREVRAKGIATELMGTVNSSQRRRSEETVIGLFWAYDGASGLGTPPRLYNQIVREVAVKKNNSAARNARLFALVNVAMADAGILAWREKYKHNLWRPVIGIREHDESMGPTGVGHNTFDNDSDPTWLPCGAPSTNRPGRKNVTPPFPAYPSGHATFGAAALQITRLFYDGAAALQHQPDDLFDGLTFVSDELNGENIDNQGTVRPRHVRAFDRGLWEMIEENGRSRVYLGVHWVFDAFAVKNGKPDLSKNIGGVPLGLEIAEDIFASGMVRSPVGPLP
ncbi:MAG: phosphatase PAP2 family protein [Actinobacteria bacterium]|nr:phosphatase PAP2 family protein [Actinomycetota bacterium]MBW3646418.1 phosphatase PAP2 family protein [Actinomycetota bacterium]